MGGEVLKRMPLTFGVQRAMAMDWRRKLAVPTIRLYEQEGLVLPYKTPTGRRLYSLHDLEKLTCIRQMITEHGVNLQGIKKVLERYKAKERSRKPSFSIFSRFGGDHWVEWTPENCPYYPCHFKGQRCDYCYCPLYPCGDESLGQWSESSNGGNVWNCSRCVLLHEPEIADYVNAHDHVSIDPGQLIFTNVTWMTATGRPCSPCAVNGWL
jgi:Zn-finger protein